MPCFIRRAIFAITVFGILLVVAAPVTADGKPDIAGDIANLSGNDDATITAIARLKQTAGDDLALLAAAASEAETNIARRLRARAILHYCQATGTDAARELQFRISVAAWEIPEGAPEFLAGEKAAARAALVANLDAETIAGMLQTYEREDYARYAVVRDILAANGSDLAIAATAKLLGSASWIARLRAVHLLGLIGNETALAAMRPAASDANAAVRERVVRAWASAGLPWVREAVKFLDDPAPAIRSAAIRALASDTDAAEKIAAALRDESFFVRRAAAETLAAMGENGIGELMAVAEADAEAGAGAVGKAAAIRALGAVATGNEKAAAIRECLQKLLASEDWAVRAAAVEAITLAGDGASLTDLRGSETHPFVAQRLAEAVGEVEAAWKMPAAGAENPPVDAGDEFVGLDRLRWLPADSRALDDALTAMKMTRADLEFDRNMSRDAYRFPVVQTALDEPLALADITREATAKVKAAAMAAVGDLPRVLADVSGVEDGEWPAVEMTVDFAAVRAAILAAGMPDAVAEALAEFLAAPSWIDDFRVALEKLSPADRELILSHVGELGWDLALLPVWDRVSRGHLIRAAHAFAGDVWHLGQTLADWKAGRNLAGDWRFEFATPFGPIAVGGSGDDEYAGSHFLILDFGGDDTYRGLAGAGARGGATADANAFAAVIDFAGEDRYVSADPVAQGAGFLGLAMLVDLAGNDTYRGTAHVQGCGWFGAGLLVDAGGDDRYDADNTAQGAAGFGVAALVDGAGDDVFYARAYAQGFGFVQGVAALAEVAGNDLYYVDGKYLQYETMPHRKLSMGQGMGFGMRSDASGGIGLLWDGAGDDVYRVNAFGQGSSYWFALGMLVDESGYDNYSAKIYAQGSGIHMGIGVLADLDGFDNYLSWGLSQSGSHDLGVSYFLDAAGNDIYTCHGTSIGGAINHAVALFIDRAGTDAYTMTAYTAMGAGDQKSQPDRDSIGIFIDLGGEADLYSDRRKSDGRFWVDGDQGAGIDR